MPAKPAEEMPKRQISRAELIFEELLSLALAKNDFTILRRMRRILES